MLTDMLLGIKDALKNKMIALSFFAITASLLIVLVAATLSFKDDLSMTEGIGYMHLVPIKFVDEKGATFFNFGGRYIFDFIHVTIHKLLSKQTTLEPGFFFLISFASFSVYSVIHHITPELFCKHKLPKSYILLYHSFGSYSLIKILIIKC